MANNVRMSGSRLSRTRGALAPELRPSTSFAQTAVLAAVATGQSGTWSGAWLGVRDSIDALEHSGWPGHAVLMLAFSAWVCLSLPSTPMEVAAGFVYGPLGGFACGLSCKLAGSCTAFLVARQLGRRCGCQMPTALTTQLLMLHTRPVLTMVGIRLTPLPLGVKNYGLGLSQVPLLPYLIAALAVDTPFSMLWASTGASCHSLADALSLHDTRVIGRVVPSILVLLVLCYLCWACRAGTSTGFSGCHCSSACGSCGGRPRSKERQCELEPAVASQL